MTSGCFRIVSDTLVTSATLQSCKVYALSQRTCFMLVIFDFFYFWWFRFFANVSNIFFSLMCYDVNCVVVAAGEVCTSSTAEILITGRRHGYLSPASLAQLSSRLVAMETASAVARTSGGTDECPWTVSVQQGQRLNVSLIVLPTRTSLTSRRDAFIDVDDDVIRRSVLLPVTWFLDYSRPVSRVWASLFYKPLNVVSINMTLNICHNCVCSLQKH